MTTTPIEHAQSLRIGLVDFVSPSEVKVAIEIEAPESVEFSSGSPRPFPRVNGYLLIPVEDGHLVGQIEWLTVERSSFPKRRGMQDFGLIDLPFPLRRLSLNPLGTLRRGASGRHTFQRGTEALPTVGAPALLPTAEQLRSIIESGARRRVRIGISPIAGNAEVSVDPDRLFGRHLAVLGNTGSGKSCSVAGLVRWSLAAASASRAGTPNARFIILDPNGEYARAFGGEDGLVVRHFTLNPQEADDKPLEVPLWFWNSAEWSSFTQASQRTQRPTLLQALRNVRDGLLEPDMDVDQALRRFLRTVLATLLMERNSGSPWGKFPKSKGFFEKVEKWLEGLNGELSNLEGDRHAKVNELAEYMEQLGKPRRVQYANQDYTKQEVDALISLTSAAHSAFGGTDGDSDSSDPDSPIPFEGADLVRSVEATAQMLNVSEYAETLLLRIRGLLSDVRMKAIAAAPTTTLEGWLLDYVGGDESDPCTITIIDLSLVPTEVVHVLTAVIARVVFEALQRYRKLTGQSFPTVLVMEEAHTFVRRTRSDADSPDAAGVCCQVFERIAREGRKFGLGLVLSSQRPSELSPTVLSQCNTFLLHRISNDVDQELVRRLVPDNLRGLLRELPSLPSQLAVLLGWASELPILVRMRDLPSAHQPRSSDPDFWSVWTGTDESGATVDRPAKWQAVAQDWQRRTDPASGSQADDAGEGS